MHALNCIALITLHYITLIHTHVHVHIYIYLAKSSEKQLKMLRTSKNMHCIRHVHTLCILMCPMHPYDSPSSLPKEAFRVCGETCCEVLWPCAVDATVRVQRRERLQKNVLSPGRFDGLMGFLMVPVQVGLCSHSMRVRLSRMLLVPTGLDAVQSHTVNPWLRALQFNHLGRRSPPIQNRRANEAKQKTLM